LSISCSAAIQLSVFSIKMPALRTIITHRTRSGHPYQRAGVVTSDHHTASLLLKDAAIDRQDNRVRRREASIIAAGRIIDKQNAELKSLQAQLDACKAKLQAQMCDGVNCPWNVHNYFPTVME